MHNIGKKELNNFFYVFVKRNQLSVDRDLQEIYYFELAEV